MLDNNEIYPEGKVKIINKKTSEVLLDTHNMILDFGRRLIRNLFLYSSLYYSTRVTTDIDDKVLSNATDASGENNSNIAGSIGPNGKYVFYAISFGDNPYGTVRDGEYKHLLNKGLTGVYNNLKFIEIKDTAAVNIEFNKDKNALIFTLNIKSDSTNLIAKDLGIVFAENGNTDKRYLFSRVSFDPIAIESDSELVLEYSIYF